MAKKNPLKRCRVVRDCTSGLTSSICHECGNPACDKHLIQCGATHVCVACQPKLPMEATEPEMIVLISFKRAPTANTPAGGISTTIKLLGPVDTALLRKLWDIEHLLNELPSDTRVHITLSESK